VDVPDTRIRVALVDDAAEVRALLRLALEIDGRFEVVGEAADGAAGAELAARLQPDVVVLDVEMPVLDGISTLPRLLAGAPATRVLVYSSHADRRHDALAAGAAAFRDKDSELSDVVDTLVELAAAGAPAPGR